MINPPPLSLHLLLDSIKAFEVLVSGATKGRKPLYLEQYEGMKRAGVALPVLCRATDPLDVTPREVKEAATSFDEVNRRIIGTLRAFRGEETKEALWEVHQYFRVIEEATEARPPKTEQQQATQIKEGEQEISRLGLNEWLLNRNSRLGGSEQERVTQTATKLAREVEFGL